MVSFRLIFGVFSRGMGPPTTYCLSILAWATVANGQQGPRKRQGWPPPARSEVHKPQSRLQGTAKRLWRLLPGDFVNRRRWVDGRTDGWQPRTSRGLAGQLQATSCGHALEVGGGKNEKMFAAGKTERPQRDIVFSHGGPFVYHDRLWSCLI